MYDHLFYSCYQKLMLVGINITGLDFNPNGELAATITGRTTCLISDISTGAYIFHRNLNNCCGWSLFTLAGYLIIVIGDNLCR